MESIARFRLRRYRDKAVADKKPTSIPCIIATTLKGWLEEVFALRLIYWLRGYRSLAPLKQFTSQIASQWIYGQSAESIDQSHCCFQFTWCNENTSSNSSAK